jgi:predicted MFS family arabinose efflux permease
MIINSLDKKIVYCILCLANFTISFSVAALAAVIPSISLDLQMPDFKVAQIITWYLIPYGLAAFFYAPLTQRFSYRKILTKSMILYAAACFACSQAQTLFPLMIGKMAMGIAAAGVIPLGLMIIGESYESSVRGRLVGFFFGCSFIASLTGILLSGVASWRWLFVVPAILGALSAILCLCGPKDILGKIHGIKVDYLRSWQNPSIRNVFFFILAISFLYHGVHKWYGVYLSQIYNMPQPLISSLILLTMIGGFIGQTGGGFITDSFGRRMTCYIGVIGLGVSTMLLAGTYSYPVLSLILFCIAMFWTIGHNGVSTVLTDFPNEERPVIASLNSGLRFLSGGLGFYVSSFFVTISFQLTFLIIGILILILTYILKYNIFTNRNNSNV